MKKLIAIIFFIVPFVVYSQAVSVDSIIKVHVKHFREQVGNEAIILIDYDFMLSDKTDFSVNDVFIYPAIDPRKMKRKKEYYMIKFLFVQNKELEIRGVNFRVKKISNKELEFINLLNGNTYIVSK